jgi:hypothetical protein
MGSILTRQELSQLLHSMAAHRELRPAAFADTLLEWCQSYDGFLDHATAGFQANMLAGRRWPQCGAEDKQANCLGKVAPVVARYAGSGKLVEMMTDAVRVHQDHDEAVQFAVAAALVLEQCVLGLPLVDALVRCGCLCLALGGYPSGS